MSLKIYNGGRYIALMRPLVVPVLVTTNLLFAWAAVVREQQKVVPTTYFVGSDGKVITSVCDPQSKLNNQDVAYALVEDLGNVLYAYERGDVKGYSARYVAFKNNIETRSPSEKVIRDQVARNIGDANQKDGPIFGQSSTFEINRKMYVTTPKGDGEWELGIQGIQTITSDKGPTQFQVWFKAIITEGDASALYRITTLEIISYVQLNK